MKKLLLAVISGAASLNYAHAQSPNLPSSVFIEYHTNDANLSDQTLYLKGVSLGLGTSPQFSGFWGAVDILSDDYLDTTYGEARFGGHVNLISQDGLYLNGTLGLGYAIATSSLLPNDVDFLTLPIGLELGFSPVPQLSIYGGVGYKWLYDITSNTTCNDGTTTNTVGSSACSFNSGIAYYNDSVGDADGIEFKIGLRLNY
jgi:hypothetical protein